MLLTGKHTKKTNKIREAEANEQCEHSRVVAGRHLDRFEQTKRLEDFVGNFA